MAAKSAGGYPMGDYMYGYGAGYSGMAVAGGATTGFLGGMMLSEVSARARACASARARASARAPQTAPQSRKTLALHPASAACCSARCARRETKARRPRARVPPPAQRTCAGGARTSYLSLAMLEDGAVTDGRALTL